MRAVNPLLMASWGGVEVVEVEVEGWRWRGGWKRSCLQLDSGGITRRWRRVLPDLLYVDVDVDLPVLFDWFTCVN